MHSKPLYFLLLVSILLYQSGCATLSSTPEQLPPLANPAGYARTALSVQQGACLAGIARITLKVNSTTQSYKTMYACIYPAMLRLEVLGLFNQPGLYISANTDTGITLFVPSQNAWYRGPATAESMQRISGIWMDPFDIVKTIHNNPPGPDPAHAHITCAQDSGNYQCRLEQDSSAQDIWIDPSTGSIIRSRLFKNGLISHDIRYQDFREINGRYMPEKILVGFDRYATSLEIKMQPPLTAPLTTEQLRLQAPDGTVFLPLHTFWDHH